MFSIDLLNGRGLPRKSSPKRTLLRGVLFLIPVMVVVACAATYQYDCAQVASQKAAIQGNQAVIEASSKDVKSYQQINSSIAKMRRCLDDLTGGLSYRIQISDLLAEFVQNLPDEIFVYEMELGRETTMEKVKDPETNETRQHLVVIRELRLILCGFDSGGNDQLVWDYIDLLKRSEILSQVFVDIKPIAQQQGLVDGRSATYYEIECTLRKQG